MWNALQARFGDAVSFQGIVRHDLSGPAEAAERARALGAETPCWFEDGSADGTREVWGIEGEPTIVVLDGAGVVVRTYDWLEIVLRPDPRTGLLEALPMDGLRARLRAEVEADLVRALGSG